MRCDGCSGSGICDACGGYGYLPDSPETDYSGTDCTVCDGTCECTECDGDGITENDISTEHDTDTDDINEQDADTVVLEMGQ